MRAEEVPVRAARGDRLLQRPQPAGAPLEDVHRPGRRRGGAHHRRVAVRGQRRAAGSFAEARLRGVGERFFVHEGIDADRELGSGGVHLEQEPPAAHRQPAGQPATGCIHRDQGAVAETRGELDRAAAQTRPAAALGQRDRQPARPAAGDREPLLEPVGAVRVPLADGAVRIVDVVLARSRRRLGDGDAGAGVGDPDKRQRGTATGAAQRDPTAREARDDATAAGLQTSIRAGPDAVCADRSRPCASESCARRGSGRRWRCERSARAERAGATGEPLGRWTSAAAVTAMANCCEQSRDQPSAQPRGRLARPLRMTCVSGVCAHDAHLPVRAATPPAWHFSVYEHDCKPQPSAM